MMPVIFLPEAEEEMVEASLYYQTQSPRLGVEFLSEVERAVKSIAASPNTWPILEGDLRRRLTKRFPFGILYRIESAAIVAIAVAHLRRKPGYWKDRIRKT